MQLKALLRSPKCVYNKRRSHCMVSRLMQQLKQQIFITFIILLSMRVTSIYSVFICKTIYSFTTYRLID